MLINIIMYICNRRFHITCDEIVGVPTQDVMKDIADEH